MNILNNSYTSTNNDIHGKDINITNSNSNYPDTLMNPNVVTNSITQVSTITIEEIPVEFPRIPYPCQIQYMKGIIEALNKSNNALLESPTGTGKTLCLLCATLAWQQHMKSKGSNLSYSSEPSTTNIHPNIMPKTAAYTIVYATRTHSQLAQVVRELRSTTYRPRMTVLGSRDQLCIHEKVSKLKNTLMNHACNSLNTKRKCMYKNNLESYMDSNASLDNTSSLDIEDMVKLGKQRSICPYFHSREFSASSEIVFVPYNYLLDTSIRKTLKLNWDKCIIIFDEAHNLERVAADAASFTFRSTDLALCIQEMQKVAVLVKEAEALVRNQPANNNQSSETSNRLMVTVNSNQKGNTNSTDNSNTSSGGLSSGVSKPRLAIVAQVINAMFGLENRLDSLDMMSSIGSSQSVSSSFKTQQPMRSSTIPGLIYPGDWLVQLLKSSGFRSEYIEEMRKCGNILLEEAQDAKYGSSDTTAVAAALPLIEPKLVMFTQAIERVFRSDIGNYTSDYKVYINEDNGIKPPGTLGNQPQHTYLKQIPMKSTIKSNKVVNFWCFSTGVAMNELKKIGVKSILLTSGNRNIVILRYYYYLYMIEYYYIGVMLVLY